MNVFLKNHIVAVKEESCYLAGEEIFLHVILLKSPSKYSLLINLCKEIVQLPVHTKSLPLKVS